MAFLFSYGTLQQEQVQLATFGRLLKGSSDRLFGYCLAQLVINDEQVVATSGEAVHPIARMTEAIDQSVPGTVFEITEAELAEADRYEVEAYQRIEVTLMSGRTAWAYVQSDPEAEPQP